MIQRKKVKKNNQMEALNMKILYDLLLKEMQKRVNEHYPNSELSSLFAHFVNFFMKKEHELFLQNNDDNKSNGFYPRSIVSSFGVLDLLIPRDKNNEFRPFLLPPPWQRTDYHYNNIILNLIN